MMQVVTRGILLVSLLWATSLPETEAGTLIRGDRHHRSAAVAAKNSRALQNGKGNNKEPTTEVPTPAPAPSPPSPPTTAPGGDCGVCRHDATVSCVADADCPSALACDSDSTNADSACTKNNQCDGGKCVGVTGICDPAPCPPTFAPTDGPTSTPTEAPTDVQTGTPTTPEPTADPSSDPSSSPSSDPTSSPTFSPSSDPSGAPTASPTGAPSGSPVTPEPIAEPSSDPSSSPSSDPTSSPTLSPSDDPSGAPTASPTGVPSVSPVTSEPTAGPSSDPSSSPSSDPTNTPTDSPSSDPSGAPTASPTGAPTGSPVTSDPSANPSSVPSASPSSDPTNAPTSSPSDDPSAEPASDTTNSPTSAPIVSLSYVYDSPSSEVPGGVNLNTPPLGECEADCDGDGQCSKGLVCFQRGSGISSVPRCSGTPFSDKDYCHIPPPGQLVYVYDNNDVSSPNTNQPPNLKECEGDCDYNSDCAGDLVCMQRSGNEDVPGCVGPGISGEDYCYSLATEAPSPPTPVPTCSPVIPAPVSTSAPTGPATYVPGNKTSTSEAGVRLSTGLRAAVIAETNKQVQLTGVGPGALSAESFHSLPDGAAVFEDECGDGWTYVSNSEAGGSSNYAGGVGAIYFDANGDVIDYKMIQKQTRRNCSGGKTWWGTWLTCEETSGGGVYEVHPKNDDPLRKRRALIGATGGNYEGTAYDNRVANDPKFFLTEDASDGPLERFRPSVAALQFAQESGDYTNLLHDDPDGTHQTDYLVLNTTAGTFTWSPNIADGRASASAHFRSCEGLDVRNGMLYMTCKANKQLFVLDLDAGTYEESSTVSGAFNGQPDQITRLLETSSGDDVGIVYFCEDVGDFAGVHGRDGTDNFYTILQDEGSALTGETTGLAFSPDRKYMYFAFQKPGKIYKVWREDGRPFGGQNLDIRYHSDTDNIFTFAS